MSLDRVANGVVVALLDGSRKRGFVYDLHQQRGEFHLYFTADMSDADAEVIKLPECKAVYFVKSLTGNPDYKENKTDLPTKKAFGRPFEVLFGDGELMRGTVETYDPKKIGFYLVPPDPNSNSTRIFVVKDNATQVTILETFGDDDDVTDWETPDPVRFPGSKRSDFVERVLRGKRIKDLARESYLPLAVLAHWRWKFLEGGAAGFFRENAAQGEDARRKARLFPPKKRLEAVLRVLLDEDAAVVSQVFLAPLQDMTEWHEEFLKSGRQGMDALVEWERGESPEALREHYETIVENYAPEPETIDRLMELLTSPEVVDAPPPGPGEGATGGTTAEDPEDHSWMD
ncbi:MAG: DUF6982 domain-containing protein [Planctomycetota bacterium]|jgi:hypothetical protein